ncbi:MAG: alpha-glucan family phosphorylase [Acidobacteria bacterium]|nr:alpha-glucan family phosphorylase [Acidobacteriota bacterium]
MRPIKTFHVRPALPARLAALEELAYNLRWSWDHETISLFRRLDRDLWEDTGHNPVLLLGSLPQERLEQAAEDEAFLAHLDRVTASLRDYVANGTTWYEKRHGHASRPLVAYFSMEFGLTECLPIYSGGLGILAGDHLKSASELGVPLVGVGLLYQKGYFRQYLTSEGWQQERRPVNDFSVMPLKPFHTADGAPVHVTLDLAGRTVVVRCWRVQVGRVTLVLLDTNIPENPPDLQDITDELYGGNSDMRLHQEIVLGVGGIRALLALDLSPRIFHMNEGHCAFLGLERIRYLMGKHQVSFHEALEIVTTSGLFTTHTPVPAGIDTFSPEQMDRYFGSYREAFGLSREAFLDLGRSQPGHHDAPFNMAVLAMRTASAVNGVSRLHGRVSRRMWQVVWAGVPVEEVPIGYVTNGVHPQSWISDDMRTLYDRYLGPRWAEQPGDTAVWARSAQIPGEELWRTHERRRERLVGFCRRRLAAQLSTRGASATERAAAEQALDPEALTIGFARRFATYKRGTLLFRDPERLARILNAADRPVQVLVAGKAHPHDEPGKALIRDIVQMARRPEFARRIVFLEDYDQIAARYLVQGVDVWLNTPRRPLEASGTSGMKAAFNGALNLSILDGWWDEGYSPDIGWAIGRGEEYEDHEYQDRVEAGALLDLLEHEIVPLFYTRGADDVPRGWVARMRSAITALCPVFNTNRMLHQYVVGGYVPADERRARLEDDHFRRARALAAWKARVRAHWREVRVTSVDVVLPPHTQVGHDVVVRATVHTGSLGPDDVAPQVCLGRLHEGREIVQPGIVPMQASAASPRAADTVFEATVPCRTSGTQGLTVRVLPRHEDLGHPHEMGLIVWAS